MYIPIIKFHLQIRHSKGLTAITNNKIEQLLHTIVSYMNAIIQNTLLYCTYPSPSCDDVR